MWDIASGLARKLTNILQELESAMTMTIANPDTKEVVFTQTKRSFSMHTTLLSSISGLVSVFSMFTITTASAQADNSRVRAIHDAFMQRDFASMTALTKSVLMGNAPRYVEENLLRLTAAAFKQNHGALPADWKLPSDIQNFRVVVGNRQMESSQSYRVRVTVDVPSKAFFSQIKITKYPDVLVLDTASGAGVRRVDEDLEDGKVKVNVIGQNTPEPVREGLYFFHLETTDGRKSDGWFLMSDHVPLETPKIVSPAVGETLSTGRPSFTWRSLTRRDPDETLSLAFSLGKTTADGTGWKSLFETYEHHAFSTQLTLGEGLASQAPVLENGRYTVVVNYMQTRKFGDMYLKKESMTSRSFYVDRK